MALAGESPGLWSFCASPTSGGLRWSQLTLTRRGATRSTPPSTPHPCRSRPGQTISPLTGPDGNPVKLPIGTHCYGAESNTGGATSSTIDHASFDDALVVDAQEDPNQAQELTLTATNTFDPTSVSVTKKVDGAGAADVSGASFTVEVSCVLDQGGTIPTPMITDQAYPLQANQTVTIDDLPVGATCWAVETDTGGAQKSAVSNGSASTAVKLVSGQTAEITVTNTFDAPTPPLPGTGFPALPITLGGLAVLLLGLILRTLARKPSKLA